MVHWLSAASLEEGKSLVPDLWSRAQEGGVSFISATSAFGGVPTVTPHLLLTETAQLRVFPAESVTSPQHHK